jgi:hypothetical protein
MNKFSLLMGATVLGAAVLSAETASAQSPPAGDGKPNIVFILMDNLGYGEVGA